MTGVTHIVDEEDDQPVDFSQTTGGGQTAYKPKFSILSKWKYMVVIDSEYCLKLAKKLLISK